MVDVPPPWKSFISNLHSDASFHEPRVESLTFLAWVVFCPISDHVVILLRILTFKFANCRVYMSELFLDGCWNNLLWQFMSVIWRLTYPNRQPLKTPCQIQNGGLYLWISFLTKAIADFWVTQLNHEGKFILFLFVWLKYLHLWKNGTFREN